MSNDKIYYLVFYFFLEFFMNPERMIPCLDTTLLGKFGESF